MRREKRLNDLLLQCVCTSSFNFTAILASPDANSLPLYCVLCINAPIDYYFEPQVYQHQHFINTRGKHTFPQNSQKYLLCWDTSIFLICFLRLAPYRVPDFPRVGQYGTRIQIYALIKTYITGLIKPSIFYFIRHFLIFNLYSNLMFW